LGRDLIRTRNNDLDYGAVGDGVTDDTAAIQAAFDHIVSLGFGGTIFFPRGVYKITDTIDVSDMKHVTVKGEQGAINSNPTIAQTLATSSCIFWAGANLDVTAPMFFFRRGNNNDFENLLIQGRSGYDGSGNRAYAGIWVDENHEGYRFRNCKIILCYIGVRVCSSYNFTNDTYEGGRVRYDGSYDATANGFGGFASDNWTFENCTFGFNTKAGLSIESAQSLDMRVQKTIFTFNDYGCFIAACQGITLDDPTFLVNSQPGIWLTGNASSGNIVVNNSHQEDGGGVGSDILFEVSGLVPALTLGKGITFNTCGGGDIIIRGASGTVTINNSILPTVSMKSAGPSLVIRNSTITELDKTVALGPGDLLHLENVNVTTTLASNWNSYDNIVLIKTTLPSRAELAEIPMSLYNASNQSDLLLGRMLSSTSASGMEGVTFKSGANFLFIGIGCYQDSSGTWIASNAAGGRVQYLQGGITYEIFSGETPGSAVSAFTTMFTSNTTVGLQLPSFAADPSATVGTLYYNTTSGKVRRRDSVGWADV
jgi:hypothetical protein